MPEEKPGTSITLQNLWDLYSDKLLAFIKSRVKDPADAKDLLQDVFIRIHRNLCCVRRQGRLESWMYQISRNAIIDYYRQRKTTAVLTDDAVVAEPDDDEDTAAELAQSLRGMIEQLSQPYREALIATEYEGLSQKELARREGLSISGAKSRVQRARNLLRDSLLACCHFEIDRRGKVIDYYERCCCCHPI